MMESVQRTVLPNGIRVVTENIQSVQSVALGFWFAVGSSDEQPAQAGISHFLEHMLFKGTSRRPTPKTIADEIDSMGGYFNAFTDKEVTCYYGRILSEQLELATDLLCDMSAHSVFADDELARERGVVLEEIKGRDDDPEDLVHDLFGETIHPEHPLGTPVIGTAASVSRLNSDVLRAYVSDRYTGANLVVSAAGNLDHARLVDWVGGALGHLSPGTPHRTLPSPEARISRNEVSPATEQVHFCLGTPGLTHFDDRRYALALLDSILGGSMGSRLFQEIREKRGLAYTVGSYTSQFREAGTFTAYAGTSLQHYAECVELVADELAKVRSTTVSEMELERAKMQFRVASVMGQESMSNRMNRIGKSECIYGRVIPLAEILERVERVSVDEIRAVAEQLFPAVPTELTLAAVGPFSDEHRVAAASEEEGDEE